MTPGGKKEKVKWNTTKVVLTIASFNSQAVVMVFAWKQLNVT